MLDQYVNVADEGTTGHMVAGDLIRSINNRFHFHESVIGLINHNIVIHIVIFYTFLLALAPRHSPIRGKTTKQKPNVKY